MQFLPGVGEARARRLAKLGLRTAQDVLFLFPRDYERPAAPSKVDNLREGVPASLVGTITDVDLVSRTPGKSVFAAIIENDSGAVRIVFFNQPFRADSITLDSRVMISGVPKLSGLRMEFVHPQVTVLEDADDLPSPKILALYPLTDGVRHSELRQIIERVLEATSNELSEAMPESLRIQAATQLRKDGILIHKSLPPIDEAIRQIHQPLDEMALTTARERFVFQELLVMQLALAMRRRKLTSDLKSPPLPPSALIDARIVDRFPFELTHDQRKAISEISQDMSCQFPMNRLLQGDVGSGKTVVAVYAMMLAVAGGHQAVLMAPTEILARQHCQTIRTILKGSRVRIGLLCGSLSRSERKQVIDDAKRGALDLIVGTQALLYADIEFAKLGLCVIDEQHKYGVSQRGRLRSGGVDPHYLVMSATPIPRSMAMTLFGDVELSTLRDKPPGRAKVNTYLAHDGWKDRWWQFVKNRLREGRQAFVVAPRVDAGTSENSDDKKPSNGADSEDISSVEAVYDSLRKNTLAEFRIGLLHGRMRAEDKDAAMQAFAEHEIDVLVSTTVIEVGIDVPNATVMTILGAQRFGLAQLHQLRGRVARGSHAGHVCVFTDGEQSPEENDRLAIFEKTDDGFELAEADYRLRGPGDMLGRKQSGMPPMRIADPSRDIVTLVIARRMAQGIIDEDPELDAESMQTLREQVMARYGKRLDLSDVS